MIRKNYLFFVSKDLNFKGEFELVRTFNNINVYKSIINSRIFKT